MHSSPVSDSIAHDLASLLEFPTPLSASISTPPSPAPLHVRVQYTQKIPTSLDGSRSRRLLSVLSLFRDGKDVYESGVSSGWIPVDTEVVARIDSPWDGHVFLQIRRLVSSGGANANASETASHAIEIWDDFGLVTQVPTNHVHGPIYTDDTFASFCFSRDGRYVYYLAQRKSEAPKEYHEIYLSGKSNEGSDLGGLNDSVGSKHEYQEDWGEAYEGTATASVFALDMETGRIHEVLSESFGKIPFISQIQLVEETESMFGLVGTVYTTSPRKLGIAYCYERENGLAWIPMNRESRMQDSPLCAFTNLPSVRFPIVCENRGEIFFLSSEKTGAHKSMSRLCSVRLDSISDYQMKISSEYPEFKTVVGIPEPDRTLYPTIDSTWFPGIFAHALHADAVMEIGERSFLLVGSECHAKLCVFAVDLDNEHRVYNLTEGYSSCQLLGLGRRIVVGSVSSPCELPRVCVFQLVLDETTNSPKLHLLNAAVESSSSRRGFLERSRRIVSNLAFKEYRVLPRIVSDVCPDPIHFFTISSKEVSPLANDSGYSPIMLAVHGGPQSAFMTSYNDALAFFAHIGFLVVAVNYRGSMSFGQHYATSLLGHIGTMDVDDCMTALEYVIDHLDGDASRCCITGGSHGGFLGAHLIGQYPDRFRAAILRNPVTFIPGMCTVTDIPDWCYYECGIPHKSFPRVEDLSSMYEKSPLQFVDRVQAAVLLFLGTSDRRVPPSQGLAYYHALRAHWQHMASLSDPELSIDDHVRLLVYKGNNHSLSSPLAQYDSWLNAVSWLFSHVLDSHLSLE